MNHSSVIHYVTYLELLTFLCIYLYNVLPGLHPENGSRGGGGGGGGAHTNFSRFRGGSYVTMLFTIQF